MSGKNEDLDDVPIGLLPVPSSDLVSGLAPEASRKAKAKVRSYQPKGYVPTVISNKKDRTERQVWRKSHQPNGHKSEKSVESEDGKRRGSYQPKGYIHPPVLGKKRKLSNPQIKTISENGTLRSGGSAKSETTRSDYSTDTLFNMTVIDYHKKAKTTIEQADNPSYFVSPETLVALKGIWLAISIAALIVGMYLQGKFYFNTLEGWHIIGLIVYFIVLPGLT
jgi:hypothetical protein